ncbi:helix-turn-helix transcriptional regulator [Rouxiella badensis]|uniref:LexA family transcriptional regulator n=1 Tax=Rouxiella badensis TaxID=1646377 RepID=UPI001D159A21|nr:helix-turn-helix transcriptional regulator [Rouxiella badensis]MCC3749723.1 helix-turn-helix transcriptional regulator [Rouxiella badensis]
MNFSKRLDEAMKQAGATQGGLAKSVGMAQSSVNKLLNGAKGSRKLVEIAKSLGVRPEWLSSGNGPMREDGAQIAMHIPLVNQDFYRVDVLDVQASAGNGTLVSTDFIEKIRAIEYTTEQARALFGNRPSDSVKVITVRGDSMEGTINPGDEIFVDTAVTHFDGDGVYVFVFGKTLHVKRLQMQRNRLSVLSDNPVYKEWFVEDGDEDQFHIMAKVILRQSIDYKRFG